MQKQTESALVRKLAFEMEEKGKIAAELVIANIQLAFQNKEKKKRAAELVLAKKEHAFQNKEKEKRAAELIIANQELIFQNREKEQRAAELIIANKELVYQNAEKGKRSAELVLANKELAFQNDEKVKRASELVLANIELAFQNEEKEKRAAELSIANKELEQFVYMASHDLQQPLRTISNYIRLFEKKYPQLLDTEALKYLTSVNNAAKRMSLLITSLLTLSELGSNKELNYINCKKVITDVIADLEILIKTSGTVIKVGKMPILNLYEPEMRQLFQNLLTNAIKFQKKDVLPRVQIDCEKTDKTWKFSVKDNGIGIDAEHFEKIFDIFQRLHGNKEFEGSGIGLANCKKIVQLHHGEIWLESMPGVGTTFYFTLPV